MEVLPFCGMALPSSFFSELWDIAEAKITVRIYMTPDIYETIYIYIHKATSKLEFPLFSYTQEIHLWILNLLFKTTAGEKILLFYKRQNDQKLIFFLWDKSEKSIIIICKMFRERKRDRKGFFSPFLFALWAEFLMI